MGFCCLDLPGSRKSLDHNRLRTQKLPRTLRWQPDCTNRTDYWDPDNPTTPKRPRPSAFCELRLPLREIEECSDKSTGTQIGVAQDTEILAYFHSAAPVWDEMYRRRDVWGMIHQQRLKRFLDLVDQVQLGRGSRVADIGCGAGFATLGLAQRGYFVEAIDAVAAMVETTRRNVRAAGLAARVNVQVGDIYRLNFPGGHFDTVLSIGVIPWLKTPGEAIIELSRILKPGGYLLFTADNDKRLSRWLDPLKSPLLGPVRRFGKAILGQPNRKGNEGDSHSQMLSAQAVDTLLAKAHLQRVYLKTLGFGPFTLLHRTFLPKTMGLALHRFLQFLADREFPLLASTGAQFLIMAKRLEGVSSRNCSE